MRANIIDGKKFSAKVKADIATEIKSRIASGQSRPGLAVVLVGENPASQIYVNSKCKACDQYGIFSKKITLSDTISEKELLEIIDQLNGDPAIHGILVQLPLPKHINTQAVVEAINPAKDVDGFHPYNLGKLAQGEPIFRPCTAFGITYLLEQLPKKLDGMDAVILGRSQIVGLPMALELIRKNCTVTVCHSKTENLSEKIRKADLLISAIGLPEYVKGDWIKKDSIVIDVGINRLENGQLTGDVEFEKAKEKAAWITPVPGGVGPMTIAMLLKNTLTAYQLIDGSTPPSHPTI